jgi:hypothetical protein
MSFDKLLSRSAALEQSLSECFAFPLYDSSSRLVASNALASLGFAHAQGLKHLVAAGLHTSAAALLRVQYESLVRALWSLYVASDVEADLLISELTNESAERAATIPMLGQMLLAIEKKAPHAPVSQLKEFKQYSWKPLCSFVHGGIHAVSRHSRGFPAPLVEGMIRNSNGLLTITANLALILSGSAPAGLIPRIQAQFRDCLPPEVSAHPAPHGPVQ